MKHAIVLDFSSCETWNEFYEQIYGAFDVPSHCGKNLSALRDVLRDYMEENISILVKLSKNLVEPFLQNYMEHAISIIEETARENGSSVTVER